MRHKYLLSLLLALSSLGCYSQTFVIKSHDPHIRYSGRIVMQDEAAELSWSASSATINFNGTTIKATLRDEHANNFLDVIVDDKVVNVIHPDSVEKEYTLVSGLPAVMHSLVLFKRTESAMGKTWVYQFALEKGATVGPVPPAKKRKMEIYGNSITCGYAVLDTTGQDRGTAPFEDGYLSYASITARHFDADLHSISRSGIGIMVSWFPVIMPDIYDKLDATDTESKWDFSKYTPDVVIINLFQNDSWIVKSPENDQFKAKFGVKAPADDQIIKAYRDFVKGIRNKYPKTQIICALGNMDATKDGSPWPAYIQKAVAQLGDKNIYTHFFAYKNTGGHPSKKEQQAMADDLIGFIDQHIKW